MDENDLCWSNNPPMIRAPMLRVAKGSHLSALVLGSYTGIYLHWGDDNRTYPCRRDCEYCSDGNKPFWRGYLPVIFNDKRRVLEISASLKPFFDKQSPPFHVKLHRPGNSYNLGAELLPELSLPNPPIAPHDVKDTLLKLWQLPTETNEKPKTIPYRRKAE